MLELARRYGYLGAFVASVLGNATIILPAPYSLFIFILGACLDPLILGLVSGLGAAIGELTGYALGVAARRAMDEERKAKLERARRLLEKPAFFVILFLAATPLPDDVVSVPLGLIGYPLWKAFPAFLMGKVILCLILAYAGRLAWDVAWLALEVGGVWSMVATGVAIVVVVALVLLIDWDVVMDVVEEKGWLGLLRWSGIKRILGTIKLRFRKDGKGERSRQEGEAAED
ncbi:hypothetical protein DRO33_05855 [Candidatus Bathyarchaeota archaeon]|nr:MAG: hypothetical protein DRO33_05855 [Candidatus Bathyarchaeota archaeon]